MKEKNLQYVNKNREIKTLDVRQAYEFMCNDHLNDLNPGKNFYSLVDTY